MGSTPRHRPSPQSQSCPGKRARRFVCGSKQGATRGPEGPPDRGRRKKITAQPCSHPLTRTCLRWPSSTRWRVAAAAVAPSMVVRGWWIVVGMGEGEGRKRRSCAGDDEAGATFLLFPHCLVPSQNEKAEKWPPPPTSVPARPEPLVRSSQRHHGGPRRRHGGGVGGRVSRPQGRADVGPSRRRPTRRRPPNQP